MDFPLYDQLALLSKQNKNAKALWPNICPVIKQLPSENLEIICALMIHHANIAQKVGFTTRNRSTIPYGGKLIDAGKGIIMQVPSIPEDLQLIIITYVQEVANMT